MAKAQTIPFSSFLILLGDGAEPEEFVAPCGLTSRGFTRTAETNDTNVPDCDDEDLPSWLERDTVSLSWSLSGEGVVDEGALDEWEAFYEQLSSRNLRVMIKDRVYEGRGKLTNFAITGERGTRVQLSVEITGDGPVTRMVSET
jgi:hypothetical protein